MFFAESWQISQKIVLIIGVFAQTTPIFLQNFYRNIGF
jgi:hypothetical protein